MGFQIKCQRSRATLGGNARQGGEILGRVFVNDGQRGGSLISRGHDTGVFDHEDYGSFRGTRAVQDSLGNHKALSRREFNSSMLEIDQKPAVDHIEEFIVSVVFVPVILTLHNSQTHHGLIDLAQCLVVPLVSASVSESFHVDHFQRLEQDVEPGFIRIRLCVTHVNTSTAPCQSAFLHAPVFRVYWLSYPERRGKERVWGHSQNGVTVKFGLGVPEFERCRHNHCRRGTVLWHGAIDDPLLLPFLASLDKRGPFSLHLRTSRGLPVLGGFTGGDPPAPVVGVKGGNLCVE